MSRKRHLMTALTIFFVLGLFAALSNLACSGNGEEKAEKRVFSAKGQNGKALFVTIGGDLQDGKVKRLAGRPLVVTITDENKKPLKGVRVLFQTIGTEGAKLIHGRLKGQRLYADTGADGVARMTFRFGKTIGVYKVEAVVSQGSVNEVFRHVFQLTGLDYQKLIFGIFGGLGLFLFGMKMMTDSLQLLAGDRLKYILEVLTRNRLVGLGVGAMVTAIVQSSSATTVMLVGFLNAGLMKLTQAIPIIFGANIGTTITGQMIAFKLGKYALPAIGVAFLLIMASTRKKYKNFGYVLMGFGLLFLGMSTMSGVFKPLRTSPLVSSAFMSFGENPVLGFMVGLVATVVLQSSSATVGLAITMAGSGLLTFHAAVPIIFGTNVGTTITAVLASLTANLAARRSACVHVCFNLFGSFIMLASLMLVNAHGQPYYYALVNQMTSGNVFAGENVARHVANAHTVFNIVFGFIFLPFTGIFASIASSLLKGDGKKRVTRLEEHLLENPELAERMVVAETEDMCRISRSMLADAMAGFMKRDEKYFTTLPEREETVDDMQAAITNYLVRLSQKRMGPEAAERIPHLLHTVNDVERVADICENIMELGERVIARDLPFSETAKDELLTLYGKVLEMMDRILLGINTSDKDQCVQARHVEKDINHLEDTYRRNHIRRLKEGKCDPVAGVVFLDLIGNLEKIGDHLDNVAKAFSLDEQLS